MLLTLIFQALLSPSRIERNEEVEHGLSSHHKHFFSLPHCQGDSVGVGSGMRAGVSCCYAMAVFGPSEHLGWHVAATLLDLFSDRMQEHMVVPMTNRDNGINWAFSKSHCHHCTQSDGEFVNLVDFDTAPVLFNNNQCYPNGQCELS